MSKINRINKRIKRIEDRFKTKVSKGIKGTDMDIELHERRIKKLKDKTSPLGFRMPHSPLNQNDSIAASKAWQNFKQGYAKVGKVETGEYDREKHEFYYDTNKKKLRLVPTDDAERQDEGFKSKLKTWQLPPLDRKSSKKLNPEAGKNPKKTTRKGGDDVKSSQPGEKWERKPILSKDEIGTGKRGYEITPSGKQLAL